MSERTWNSVMTAAESLSSLSSEASTLAKVVVLLGVVVVTNVVAFCGRQMQV